jgi:hypothetical protein
LISKGRETFENPDSLVDEFEAIPEGELQEFKADYLLAKIFRGNFEKNFDDEKDKFDDDLELPRILLDWGVEDRKFTKNSA